MTMTVNVGFLPETSFEDSVRQAKEKALEWDVAYVCYCFDGVICMIGRDADVGDVCDMYIDNNTIIMEG